MTPQVPLPTDSFHKFLCLLGLAMVLSGLLGFYALYTNTLTTKVALVEEISQLEMSSPRSQLEEKRLELKKRILEVTRDNEKAFGGAVLAVAFLGVAVMVWGGIDWHRKGQALDDKMRTLQLERLELELSALRASSKSQGARSPSIEPANAPGDA